MKSLGQCKNSSQENQGGSRLKMNLITQLPAAHPAYMECGPKPAVPQGAVAW